MPRASDFTLNVRSPETEDLDVFCLFFKGMENGKGCVVEGLSYLIIQVGYGTNF